MGEGGGRGRLKNTVTSDIHGGTPSGKRHIY